MKKQVWHSRPPPSVGWYPASFVRNDGYMRWWDGKKWSFPAHETYTAKEAAYKASFKASLQSGIEWRDRPASWPARSKT